MKSMQAPLVAIFFVTYFHRAGGPWPPWPPGSATDLCMIFISDKKKLMCRMVYY